VGLLRTVHQHPVPEPVVLPAVLQLLVVGVGGLLPCTLFAANIGLGSCGLAPLEHLLTAHVEWVEEAAETAVGVLLLVFVFVFVVAITGRLFAGSFEVVGVGRGLECLLLG